MTKLRSLVAGELPLAEAFWTWTLGVGLAVNLVTSGLFLALITADRPWIALLAGYGFSLPYNLVALVGVWRSAARYEGPAFHAELARGGAAALLLVLSAT